MDLGLRDKIALVAASSKGLGKAAALELSREGAKVAICARNKEQLLKTKEEISSLTGQDVHIYQVDVTQKDQIHTMVEEIVQEFGIKSHLEHGLMVTYLQSAEYTAGKWSLLYFKDDDTLQAYLALKEKKRQLEEAGQYDEPARREVSRAFMRLLSYPEDVIEERIAKNAPR